MLKQNDKLLVQTALFSDIRNTDILNSSVENILVTKGFGNLLLSNDSQEVV